MLLGGSFFIRSENQFPRNGLLGVIIVAEGPCGMVVVCTSPLSKRIPGTLLETLRERRKMEPRIVIAQDPTSYSEVPTSAGLSFRDGLARPSGKQILRHRYTQVFGYGRKIRKER